MCFPIIIVPGSALCFQAECRLLGVIFILLAFCGRGTHSHSVSRQPDSPGRDVGAYRGHQALFKLTQPCSFPQFLCVRNISVRNISMKDMTEVLLSTQKTWYMILKSSKLQCKVKIEPQKPLFSLILNPSDSFVLAVFWGGGER